jgi:hypothetical protein
MKVSEALAGVRSVFLDTAPLIYHVERHPAYAGRTRPIFQRIDAGSIEAVTSSIALVECLVVPLRRGDTALATRFRAAITTGASTRFVGVDAVAEHAADLRRAPGLRVRVLDDLDPVERRQCQRRRALAGLVPPNKAAARRTRPQRCRGQRVIAGPPLRPPGRGRGSCWCSSPSRRGSCVSAARRRADRRSRRLPRASAAFPSPPASSSRSTETCCRVIGSPG